MKRIFLFAVTDRPVVPPLAVVAYGVQALFRARPVRLAPAGMQRGSP